MQYKVAIPHIYYSLAASGAVAGSNEEETRENKIEKLREYVIAYAEKTYPDWNLQRIEGRQMVLVKKQ
jgi:uncharacterized protein YutD